MWKCEYLQEPIENLNKRIEQNIGPVLLTVCCQFVENPSLTVLNSLSGRYAQKTVRRSTRGPGEASARQNMQVNMKNALARAGAIVDHRTVSFFNKALVCCDLCCCQK